MEFTPPVPEKLPQPYFILQSEFKSAPNNILPYSPLERVTRENFVNFLIRSFAISMGQPVAQVFFFVWLNMRTGFNWEQTFENFVRAGGWDVFSEEEKKIFKNSFMKVSMHTDKYMEFEIDDEISSEVNHLYQNIKGIVDSPLTRFGQLSGIESFQDFNVFASDQVRRLREPALETEENFKSK